MLEVIFDTLLDTLKLLPFLFFTYLLMEFLEHKAGKRAENIIKKSGNFGPVFGSILGLFPQCGFSASAASLYSGGIITVGTLIAIFFSTSDEMLPILISHSIPAASIVAILGIKVLIAIIVGLLSDVFVKHIINHNKKEEIHIVDICEEDHCHCEKGIVRSALHHTSSIVIFILIISFLLNTCIYFIGEEKLGGLFVSLPVIGNIISAIIGLIPNCAASVAITELYISGIISFGSLMSGLLIGAGVGILILFKTNHHRMKNNILIVATMFVSSIIVGAVIDLIGFSVNLA